MVLASVFRSCIGTSRNALDTLKAVLVNKTQITLGELRTAAVEQLVKQPANVHSDVLSLIDDPAWLTLRMKATEGKLFTFDGSTIRKSQMA